MRTAAQQPPSDPPGAPGSGWAPTHLPSALNLPDPGNGKPWRTPYTDSASSRGAKLIEGSEGYWGKFPEVFDPSFAESVRRSMAPKVNRSAGDPWCLGYFCTKAAEQYFRVVRDVIKAVAPNQLYLGCRFAWVNARAAAAAAKYCDVVSYNLYQRSVAEFKLPGGLDVPLIIGEFHFGTLDRGMFHTGLVPVANQAERAEAYRAYVEGALRHPQFVGTRWFQYQDEPTTGRVLDEENYQIGFVDLADTPYPEMTRVSRSIGERLYRWRLGK
jgi:hypothetical protein